MPSVRPGPLHGGGAGGRRGCKAVWRRQRSSCGACVAGGTGQQSCCKSAARVSVVPRGDTGEAVVPLIIILTTIITTTTTIIIMVDKKKKKKKKKKNNNNNYNNDVFN